MYQLYAKVQILKQKYHAELHNFLLNKNQNECQEMSSDLLNNQMLDASLKAYDWRVKTVAILLSQIFIHLVEPLFFQILHFLK